MVGPTSGSDQILKVRVVGFCSLYFLFFSIFFILFFAPDKRSRLVGGMIPRLEKIERIQLPRSQVGKIPSWPSR